MRTSHQRARGRRYVRERVILCASVCGLASGALLLGPSPGERIARADQPTPVSPDISARRGLTVYQTNCLDCHGEKGDGNGPMARFLYPKPRNFGEGKFRIVTTVNAKPSDEDLLLVINHGMPGSAMFPFAHVPEADKKALIAYLRELTREAWVEYAKRQAEAMEDTVDVAELRQAALTQLKPGDPFAIPNDLPKSSDESVARGAKLYATGCAACHGATGKGDGVQAQKNDDGTPTRPRDLTRGLFKGSRDPNQLYARLMLGMPGSPMPSSAQTLKPSDAGDLVNFLLSLSSPETTAMVEHKRTSLTARRTAKLPADGDDTAWQGAAATRITLSPLWWRDYEEPNLHVAALHDGQTLAIRLSWTDHTQNTKLERPEDFLDMAAVQFHRGEVEPFLGMGAADKGQVDLWLWRAGTPARDDPAHRPLDDYPFDNPIYRSLTQGKGKLPPTAPAQAAGNPNSTQRDASALAARGAGSTTFLPPVSQLVSAKATWKDGRWTVVLRRPLKVPADGLNFVPGEKTSIAFAIWDGAARDRNGQKLVSIWHDFKIE